MKTLFVLASAMVVLFLATPTMKIPVSANKIEAQTGGSVSGLEARVAKLEKRLAAVEAQLARIAATTSGASKAQPGHLSGPSRDNGTRFIGNWSDGSYDYLSISKDGGKYIVREKTPNGSWVHVCELNNGSLKCGQSDIDFIESSGHTTWHGKELKKLP